VCGGEDDEHHPYLRLVDPDPEGPKHAVPADPDPQHWSEHSENINSCASSGWLKLEYLSCVWKDPDPDPYL
jgi:hypothetical protein